MDEFLLVFRRDFKSRENQPSPEQLQEHFQKWHAWYDKMTAEDRIVLRRRWDGEGLVVNAQKTVLNGPYAEIKETIGGAVIIRAASYEEAAEIAQEVPILEFGGNVEIRKAL
ncbi:MAG: transcription initiation protein [Dyadobacter sp.]|uniref:YciI family protein n=1 Tax=Dyadobacter sp. TaxID=1914288 RepID=UPI001B2BEDEF|nr:YciI family protein [Dyadobacter sp.]MBO9611759.1 transcription initiation protein [Dyadobacter sp.]